MNMFFNCAALKELPNTLSIPNTVTDITNMFYGCSALKNVPENLYIPNSVKTINGLFTNCNALLSLPSGLSLPNSITRCDYAFAGCRKLTKLPNNLTIPSANATALSMFSDCSELTSLPDNFTINYGTTDLRNMFNGCSKLKVLPANFNIPSSVVNTTGMFKLCIELESLPNNFTIPNSVTTTYLMFSGCSKLKNISTKFNIPNTATNLSYTFNNCTNLSANIENIFPSTFITDSSDFTYMFTNDANLYGNAPANMLWNDISKSWISTGCFQNCTGLNNYSFIPNTWGGPNTSPLIAEPETINLTRYVSALFRLQFYSNPYIIPTFEIVSGLLPEGLTLDSSTGYITGTPYLYQTVTVRFKLTVNNQGVETVTTKDVTFVVTNSQEPTV